MGWFTDGFFPATGNITNKGTGDDLYSLRVDGQRVLIWQNGNDGKKKFGSRWKNGDVIGLAFDTKAKQFTVSVMEITNPQMDRCLKRTRLNAKYLG